MTADLAGFLLAQLDADETVARAATEGPWAFYCGDVWSGVTAEELQRADDIYGPQGVAFSDEAEDIYERSGHLFHGDPERAEDAAHIALHDPAFELDRIAAIRAVVELAQATIQQGLVITGGAMLRVLAQPYRGRPGWRDEWGTG